MKKIQLNCDMGEGFGIYTLGLDEQIMPHIDMANLACGFHASDPLTMHQSISLAKKHNVTIGCHPAYPDLVGFGRREMSCSSEEIVAFVIYQLGALDGLCRSRGMEVSYLKPHGALYNMMMKDDTVFKAIAKAISLYDKEIKLMILSTLENARYEIMAQHYRIKLLYEVFADRSYDDEGRLVPRSQEGAVLNHDQAIKRAKLLLDRGVIETISGKERKLQADTLCVHGDNQEAVEMVKALHAL